MPISLVGSAMSWALDGIRTSVDVSAPPIDSQTIATAGRFESPAFRSNVWPATIGEDQLNPPLPLAVTEVCCPVPATAFVPISEIVAPVHGVTPASTALTVFNT